MNVDSEILVHISAPATRGNDDLYRNLTDAYLGFEPYTAEGFQKRRNEAGDAGVAKLDLTQAPPLASSQQSSHPPSTDPGNTTSSKDSYGSFPSHVASADRSASQEDVAILGSFGTIEESILSTSRLGRLERIQARWRETRGSDSSFLRDRGRIGAPVSSGANGDMFIENTQLAAQAIESQLFDEYSTTSEDTSESDVDAATDTEIPASLIRNEDLAPKRPVAESLWRRSQKLIFAEEPEAKLVSTSEILEAATQDCATTDTNSSLGDLENSVPPLDFSRLPSEVCPPAPKITVLSPATLPSQVTRHLETLKQQNPQRFKPSKRLRTLDTDERGHWLIDCAGWARKVQYEFWISLCDDIRSGKLGWGVTLHRDSRRRHGLGQARVYCWGEVVEHVWLSLWLCSKGKIVSSGSRWLDAEDEMVIEMA
ncbi:hypothetical protein BU26DRAFT_515224 [Trematosphaeria pertusa]|uniref:Uncharacterized protein n=1 Tax=Trematosphaeria pertusa TaxID=390896 RepID=A0A6A6IQD5_9PLEO|nr:uncharacterized protein BU26DRAFT_515224 [Trematosphaeria pertusa]KAF2252774.1 hypothetical protein BU26DRAFT_515224 [Trematosphaeria pertusa]